MKFLVDENLSRRVAHALRMLGYEAWHVVELTGAATHDRVIWREGVSRGAIIVSKDSDFIQLLADGPPYCTVVRLRLGNCATATAIDLLVSNLDVIAAAIADGAWLIELP